ncbi:MAG: DNA repair protein RecN [Chitinophagales bacterium]
MAVPATGVKFPFIFANVLHKLNIRNYAIIDRLDIEFCDSMNIITGETGAGKSILLGALGLILGERADTKVLYDQEEKCIVEADFDITGYDLKTFFAANELDFEAHTIVRREINQSGKSRAFINDTPVTLNVLKELGEKLVNLHNQHETLELTKGGFQLNVVDLLAKNKDLLLEYRTKLAAYKKDHRRLEELQQQYRSVAAELDYLQFQLSELADANLQGSEQGSLEAEQNTLSNVEEIKRALQQALQLLEEGEISALSRLSETQGVLKNVKNLNNDIQTLAERLHSVYVELKDISDECNNLQDATSLDPERLEEVNSRLNVIYRLQKKHNVTSVDDLLTIQQTLEEKVSSVDNSSSEIEKLKASLEQQHSTLVQLGDKLHAAREKVLREFQNNVVVLLTKVGMPNASFKVDIKKLAADSLNENGLTEIKFLFSANKGFAPQEIKDVASGGELSRLMLCIKSLVADVGALPTMIFDEIDSGISGGVALKVGEIMKSLSKNHQLISITHLPQIARTAAKHLYIYKETRDNRTYTRIKELQGEERVIELAKMLGGDVVSEAALANAREMIAMV